MNVVAFPPTIVPIALVLIDFQLPWDRRPSDPAPVMALRLLAHVRRSGWPILHVLQGCGQAGYPLKRPSPSPQIMDGFHPMKQERVFHRGQCLSAFGANGFVEALGHTLHHALIVTPRFSEAGIATLYEGIERGYTLQPYAEGCSSSMGGAFDTAAWRDLPLIVEHALKNVQSVGGPNG